MLVATVHCEIYNNLCMGLAMEFWVGWLHCGRIELCKLQQPIVHGQCELVVGESWSEKSFLYESFAIRLEITRAPDLQ